MNHGLSRQKYDRKDGCVTWINHLRLASAGNDLGVAPEKILRLAIHRFF